MVQHSLDGEYLHKDTRDYEADCCVICLDTISERAQALPCGHKSFDYVCLLSWLEHRIACPLCNAEITRVHYGFGAGQNVKIYNVPLIKAALVEKAQDPRPGTNPRDRRNFRQRRPIFPPIALDPDEAILRRRYIYQHKLYALHVGSNRISRFRDLTPHLFSTDTELVSRARKWIRRELQVFVFLPGAASEPPNPNTRAANNVEFLLEYIIAILKAVDTQGSGGQAEDMLQGFLGRENTRHFLHELRAWLRSPFTSLDDWDRHVQYSDPTNNSDEPMSDQRRQPSNISFERGISNRMNRDRHVARPSPRYTPYDVCGRNRSTSLADSKFQKNIGLLFVHDLLQELDVYPKWNIWMSGRTRAVWAVGEDQSYLWGCWDDTRTAELPVIFLSPAVIIDGIRSRRLSSES